MPEAMGRLRRTGVVDTYILLLAITLLGSYMILFSSKEETRLETNNDALDQAEVERQIEDTRDRIFHISYYPVFEKHYHRFFTASLKERNNHNEMPFQPSNENSESPSQDALHYHQIWMDSDKIIDRNQLFPDSSHVDKVIHALANAKIVHVDLLDIGDYESGTAEKWVIALEGGQKAVVKLVWEEKGTMKKNALCNFGYEMPWAEIAAFHFHRLLGFRNTPYVAGRKINLRTEILPVASPGVMKQIHVQGQKVCVVGKCYHCEREDRLCPEDDLVEASVSYWIPRHLKLYTWWPLYMPFSTPRMEEWRNYGFNNKTYCDKVRQTVEPYEQRQFYLDLFDFAVLDTFMYHFDSKHYAVDDSSTARGATIRLDHGRAFCAYDRDEEELFLAPLIQCCTLRKTTYDNLQKFKKPGTLSQHFREANNKDQLAPLLADGWYSALERRLKGILDTVDRCAKANGGLHKVLV